MLAATAARAAPVTATVTGLHSAKGQVLACMTAKPKAYPDCDKDPAARKRIVKAGASVTIDFGEVPAGSYAIAVIHDENANGKMDKKLILPAEGYGFSRDAPVRMGPPKFAAAAFKVADAPVHQTLRMRYM